MKPATWTVILTRCPAYGTAAITRPGRASPVYEATRPTCEAALVAAFAGARMTWVPGTHVATYRTRTGAERRVNLAFVAEGGAS